MPKILIIEDEVNLRKILKYDLKHANYDVFEASDGLEGYTLAMSNQYDLIIIDWMLPGMQGIEIVEQLREHHCKSILFMLTAKDDEADILQAFELGVDDYVTKPFSPRELLARIKVHLRKANTHSEEAKIGNVMINFQKRQVVHNQEVLDLTKKEFDLLSYLIRNRGRVLSRDEILNEIWGFEYDNDTRIVDVHIFKLRSKLTNTSIQIKSNRGVGYQLEEVDHA